MARRRLKPEEVDDENCALAHKGQQPAELVHASKARRFPVARHTKGNLLGIKKERPNLRVVAKGWFGRMVFYRQGTKRYGTQIKIVPVRLTVDFSTKNFTSTNGRQGESAEERRR